MLEKSYERINDYDSIAIQLASPNDIRSWSYGEVKNPETINYRTYKPEKDGLFCEKIFGPEKDWECHCGKYKGIKYKDIICDRCGVKITQSKVRRTRMGHINLSAPVVHIWFFKAMPSRIASLLGVKNTLLQQVIYYQKYIVVSPGETPLKLGEILTDEAYKKARAEYGDRFVCKMGGEAIKDLLRDMTLDTLTVELRNQLRDCRSKQTRETLIKRLRISESLRRSGNKAEWMVLDVIPVIPPDLRPLVPLDSGNFATSDLNDLYRRVINRNNRLKKLLELNAPSVIIRNEKRMLQQAVDALFDNNRCKRPVLGSGNRPLKSLSDMIKGKQGRFRENLLGKRVDYSARSVITVGPELELNQCGIPKKIALELFQPFIIRRLKEKRFAETIKSAKKMLERKDEEVWDVLEEVIEGHPVLLNRAPTLHRMGIQAFKPVLIEGNSIQIHPLVCHGFNADFDGDQMAVHLPLSLEAQIEADLLMLSTENIFSPAHGQPIIRPDQDIVLGCYYLTAMLNGMQGENKSFGSEMEAILAREEKKKEIDLHARVKIRINPNKRVVGHDQTGKHGVYETTVGRIVFNDILPEEMDYYNITLDKKSLNRVISDCYARCGRDRTVSLLDSIKRLGFHEATLSGMSFSAADLIVPTLKDKIIKDGEKNVEQIERDYLESAITEGERHHQIVEEWTRVRDSIGEALMYSLRTQERDGKPYLNPIYVMADSGARGSVTQIRQLAGMRGLMAKPSGEIIEVPIKANFREGLTGFEYFISTHGARKGLADTALKTADSGYLTRKLVEVAQDMIVTIDDCGTLRGVSKGPVYLGDKLFLSLAQNILGRVARHNIVDRESDDIIVRENELITPEIAERIEHVVKSNKVQVRSPLTCEAPHGICAKCYGMDLSLGMKVEIGLAAGIIAAQSIGEPGTQLTMRTFHYGGIATQSVEKSEIPTKLSGVVDYRGLKTVVNEKGETRVLNHTGEILILDDKGRILENHTVPYGAIIRKTQNMKVKAGDILFYWEPHFVPILSEKSGHIRLEDIQEDITMREEKDKYGNIRRIITEHKGDFHPQITIVDDDEKIQACYPIPEKAYLEVEENQFVSAGSLLAKTPRTITGTQDITGGLPRVTELFEARRPKDPAIVSEIDGVVEIGEKKRGRIVIRVKNEETGMAVEHLVSPRQHQLVHTGDRVKAGTALVKGALVLQDIIRINGEEILCEYLLNEIQNVYRTQNVRIDDKHCEIIIRQMLRKVQIEDPGDTEYLPSDVVNKYELMRINREIQEAGGQPATFQSLILGVARASLRSESFIAAASFQETTKVLTEAAIAGRRDALRGLKENVILGHIIPAGTGYSDYYKGNVLSLVEPEPPVTEEVPDGEPTPTA